MSFRFVHLHKKISTCKTVELNKSRAGSAPLPSRQSCFVGDYGDDDDDVDYDNDE